MRSAPLSPNATLLPVPVATSSSPSPASTQSSPPRAITRSSPAPARMTSAPSVPRKLFGPPVPSMLDPRSGHSTAPALPAPDGQATTAAMDTRTAARTRADELGLTPPTVRGPPPERKRGLSHDVGVVLPCDDAGVGRAVVLLHAGVADRRMWAELV